MEEREQTQQNKLVWNPGTLLSPVPPALVTCGTLEHPNVLTIAWTGIVNTIPPMTDISVRPQRHSYPLIRQSGEFVINLTTAQLVPAADYCGVRSGAKENKFERCQLTPVRAAKVQAPLLAESPLSLECKVRQVLELGSHHLFLAEIVAVDVSPQLVDQQGKLHLERAHLAAFAHGEYFELGRSLGTFGYTVRKKKDPRPRRDTPPSKGPSAVTAGKGKMTQQRRKGQTGRPLQRKKK